MQLRKDWLFITITMVLALALRLDFLFSGAVPFDSDEAIVGLMAKHMQEGSSIPTFYYGQHYMGSFEAMLASVFFSLFGRSVEVLQAVPLVFSLLLIPVLYLIGYRCAGRSAGRVSALYAALAPSVFIIWSLKARGGFMELIFIGALATLYALHSSPLKKSTYFRTFMIGFLLGFGWWVNNQIAYFMLAIFTWFGLLALQSRDFSLSFKHFCIAIGSFLLGSLPYWIYNFQNKFVSLEMLGSASSSEKQSVYLTHLAGFFGEALPILSGARRFWHDSDILPGFSYIVIALYILLFFCVIFLRDKRKENDDFFAPKLLLIFLLFAAVGIFTASSFGYLSKAPRYLLPLLVPFSVLLGIAFAILHQRSKKIAISVLGLVLLINLASSYYGGRARSGQPFIFKGERVQSNHAELIEWLKEHQYKAVHTNYWIGYRLAFETDEQVIFSVFQYPHQVRINKYEQRIKQYNSDQVPYVLSLKQCEIVASGFKIAGYEFKRTQQSGYCVLYDVELPEPLANPIESSLYTVSATHHADAVRFAVDDDLKSRWGSATAQRSGMEFYINFNQATSVSALSYRIGEYWHDFPRGLTIIGVSALGHELELLSGNDYRAISYISDTKDFDVRFEPQELVKIVLRQTEDAQVFDWTIAELEVYAQH